MLCLRVYFSACVRACVRACVPNTSGTLCARLSPNRFTYLHISTIIVDVQDTFNFDLGLISDPGQGHNQLNFSCILYIRQVVLCVCDSAQTASHICTYLVPIIGTIIVDVQDTFHFDLDLISNPGQGHNKLSFSAYFI